MPFILGLLLLLGAGTGAVAQNTVPGDTLYPVKIHVNENIESALALTAQADANVDVNHAIRRLKEAKKLASKNALTSDKNTQLQTLLAQEITQMDSHISDINKGGDTQSASNIKARFTRDVALYSKALSELSKVSTTTGAFLEKIKSVQKISNSDDDKKSTTTVGSSATVKIRESGEDGDDDISSIDRRGDRGRGEDDDDDDDDDRGSQSIPPVTNPPVPTPTPTPTPTPSVTTFTLSQVAQHNTASNCYSVVSGSVYDLTSWIKQHPGGQSAIVGMCGVDATSAFMSQHGGQGNPAQELASFKIGIVK